MFVASFVCHVKPENLAELRASLASLMERTRWLSGCLDCRLVSSADDVRSLTLIHEWTNHHALAAFLDSPEYHILLGMRFLMDEEPRLAVDEVVTRARIPIRREEA